MGYKDAYQEAWNNGGPEGALAFMKQIFHDPDNQHVKGKPTDYISDRDDEEKTAAAGFDQMMALFSPKRPIAERVEFIMECLTERRSPADDQQHRSTPFNAFVLNVSTYDHGDASLYSAHFDEETGAWKRQYDLAHELVNTVDNFNPETDDDDDSYHFIYQLENSDRYHIKYEGEEISGEVLFRHIRLAQYGRLMATVIDALFADEGFADFPKVLPFRFLVNDSDSSYESEGTIESRYEFHPMMTEASFEGHPLRERHLKSAEPPPELTPEENWLYLSTYLAKDDTPEHQQLIELLRSNDQLLGFTNTLADESMTDQASRLSDEAADPPPPTGDLAGQLRALFDGDVAAIQASPLVDQACEALEFPRQRFNELTEMDEENRKDNLEQFVQWVAGYEEQAARGDHPILIKARRRRQVHAAPREYAALLWALGDAHADRAVTYARRLYDLPVPELPHDDIEDAIRGARALLDNIYPPWREIPEAHRDRVREAFDGARERLKTFDHPVIALMVLEQEMMLEHGPDIIRADRWGEVEYDLDKIPESYVDAVAACIEEMPQKFQWYGDKWDFVMNRVQGLGKRALAVAPRLIKLMNDYCTELRDGGQALENFARILYKVGLNEPPRLIREYAENKQYHSVENYAEWASRAPKKRWETFQTRFSNSPDEFGNSTAWEEVLYDSEKGVEIFVEGITESETLEAILDRLMLAAAAPGKLTTRLVYGLADRYNKKRHKAEDAHKTEKVVRLLSALPALDEEHRTALRRGRLLLLRFAIDDGAPEAPEQLTQLLDVYPEQAMLRFNQAELAFIRDGAEAAAAETLSALEALSADDMVYRKAFFQFTDNDQRTWEAASSAQGYAGFRWAVDYLRKDGYRNGQFVDGQKAMDHDPFYRAMQKVVAQWTDEERRQRLEGVRAELEFGDQLRTLSLAQLVEHLSADNWNISFQIAGRLVEDPDTFREQLLGIYGWFRENEEHRLALASLYWPAESLQEPLIRNEAFQQDLPWFIRRYPGIGATELAKIVFTKLSDANLAQVVLDTARELEGRTVIGAFKSVSLAVQQLGHFTEGIEILDHIREDTSPKKPEFVLITSNRGVFEYVSGNKDKAAATFDELFAMDWSRFDYEEDEDDMMKEILGGDLDAQIRDVFVQYFASAKFNAACVYANTDRKDEAIAALAEAHRMLPDSYDAGKYEGESDFDPIREEPAYQELLAKMGGN